MAPEKHEQINTLPSAAAAALRAGAMTRRLPVEILVDHVLGHRVFAPGDVLADAMKELSPYLDDIRKLGGVWQPSPPPRLIVMAVGATITNLDATEAAIRRFFTDDDYPVRIALSRPASWLFARHAGTSEDMRDVEPPPGFLAEVESGLAFQKPPPRPVGEEELARALHEAGREAVERGLVVVRVEGRGFLEWDALSPEAREGRIVQARAVLARFEVFERTGSA